MPDGIVVAAVADGIGVASDDHPDPGCVDSCALRLFADRRGGTSAEGGVAVL